MDKCGTVHLVGGGCGDYDLITLRGVRLLSDCDAVVYDSLTDKRLLDLAPQKSEKIYVGKRAGRHSLKQDEINTILIEKALEGKTVVRLKGGDPFVFGRGGEEILSLRSHNIRYDITPGISSSIAVPELSGIPVTHRNVSRSFHVITAHTAENSLPENMELYAKLDGTLVFLMGLGSLSLIAESLIKNGKDKETPAAVISNGATPSAVTVRGTLADITEKTESVGVSSPAVIVVGDTAKLDLLPENHLPLYGKTVAVTGTKRFADKLERKLVSLGAYTRNVCRMAVTEYTDNMPFDNALRNISDYSVVALTSINGAEIFFSRLRRLKIDLRRLCGIRFAVIGSGTEGVLEEHGIIADIVPDEYTSSSLAYAVVNSVGRNEKVLILRAEKGSKALNDIFSENGIPFDDIKTYDVECNDCPSEDKLIKSDFLTFASSSGVEAFFKNGYSISSETKVICIGEITAASLRCRGDRDFKISRISDTDGIVQTILTEVENEKIQTAQTK